VIQQNWFGHNELLAEHFGATPLDAPPTQQFLETDSHTPLAHMLVVTVLVLEQLVPEMV